MRALVSNALTLTLLAGAPLAMVSNSTRPVPLTPAERSHLGALSSPGLESPRAGAPVMRPAMATDERASLRQAQSRSRDLEALRAGDISLSDRDLKLILYAAAAVLLIVLIA